MKDFNPALRFFLFDVVLIVIMVLIYHMCY